MPPETTDTSNDLGVRIDAEECARRAGLSYVSDAEPGIERKRWGRGFTYIHPDGSRASESTRGRIIDLTIPPAWTDIWICPNPSGHIQATGRDAGGRKQYIYHPEWERARNEEKFKRIIAFGESISGIRERCQADLRRRGLPFEKVLGAVIFLLDRTLIRIGNHVYAAQNGSFGLTTLRDRHVDFAGTRCTFEFEGKSGKKHSIELNDRRLARIVRRCRDVPGYQLFQYYNEENKRDRIDSSDVNDYLREVTGQDFSAKDFRTWGAGVQAAIYLGELEEPESEQEAEKQVVRMVKAVAAKLGNTPAICRDYYIHPDIISSYVDGTFSEHFLDGLPRRQKAHLELEEAALLHFFRKRKG